MRPIPLRPAPVRAKRVLFQRRSCALVHLPSALYAVSDMMRRGWSRTDYLNGRKLREQATLSHCLHHTFALIGASTAWNSLPALAKLVLFNGNVADITGRRNGGWLY